jgi:hypothetical protein
MPQLGRTCGHDASLFMAGASLATLFSALFRQRAFFFGFRDYDMQASLPLRILR